jgi:hypothetical protein
MASWQLALRWSGLLNVGQAASLPLRGAVLGGPLKRTAHESAQGAHGESGGQGHRRKEGAVGARDVIHSSQATHALVAGASRLSACARHVHSDHPFYGKSQGGGLGGSIFLWWYPLFLHRRKTRKIKKSRGSVQRLFSDCELDTWVNEKKPSALSDFLPRR